MPCRTLIPAQRYRWARLIGSVSLAAMVACGSRPKKTDVEVEVMRVAIDEASRSPVVVLQDKAHSRALPIWVGVSEAQSIAMQLEGVEAPRPLTHDLMKNVLDRIGVEFKRVLIHDLREGTYLARIELRANGDDVTVDSRPSDGIALAVRFNKPIFVTASLLAQEQVINLRASGAEGMGTSAGITVQVLTRDLAEYFELPAGQGVLVADVASRTSTLHRGDVILEIDGSPVRGLDDFRTKMGEVAGRVNLGIQRGAERLDLAYEADAD